MSEPLSCEDQSLGQDGNSKIEVLLKTEPLVREWDQKYQQIYL